MTALENRIPPPVVFLICGVSMWLAAFVLDRLYVLGALRWPLIGMFFLLALVAPLGIIEFRRSKTTIDPINIDKASTLVTTGVFGLTRNPMYLGMTCLLIAWGLYLSVPWLWGVPLLFVLFITRFQILPEERVMAAKFGPAYESYRARVRRWI
jgi:protein-S-isoprenylcysteine O-methyltransferase Ste14